MNTYNPSPIHFLESRHKKALLVLVIFGIAFILAFLINVIVGKRALAEVLLNFLASPMRLLFLLPSSLESDTGEMTLMMRVVLLGWLLYGGLIILIVLTTNHRRAIALFIVLISLLIANLAGLTVAVAQ